MAAIALSRRSTTEGRDMKDTTYNGWANYATWRVRLEMFDGIDPYEQGLVERDADIYTLATFLEDYVREYIIETSTEGLARDYALAFLSNVDWDEIAEHMVEDYCDD